MSKSKVTVPERDVPRMTIRPQPGGSKVVEPKGAKPKSKKSEIIDNV